ncbi:DUF1330 domain-containing protein [Pediococcus parvulus]|uniref:DUF1330 domain-containing protein n=1 Tax=Pediococcus parvulus TaxID=54062 RepID=UPI00345EB68C
MAAYMVYVRDRIIDPEELKKYEEESSKVKVTGAKTPLAFYGKVETLEGPEVDSVTIVPFESMKAAEAAYNNPDYQKAMKHRLKGADYRVFITEGVK